MGWLQRLLRSARRVALSLEITNITWQRFLDPSEPVFGLVAERDGELVGLTHFLFHRSTTRIELTCYLQDLFTAPVARGQGVGKSLIEAAHLSCRADGIGRLYWQTHESNTTARLLYDKLATFAGFIVYSRDLPSRVSS